jgi:hypothetical protein
VIDLDSVLNGLKNDEEWSARLANARRSNLCRIHLAVFVEPFLRYVLDGSKTIESRFSQNAMPPFGRVDRGDIVLLKRSSGPVVGISEVGDAWHYELNPLTWQKIRSQFWSAMKLENSGFIEQKANASFATLIRLDHVIPCGPIVCSKRDRRGWVILRGSNEQSSFFADSTPSIK